RNVFIIFIAKRLLVELSSISTTCIHLVNNRATLSHAVLDAAFNSSSNAGVSGNQPHPTLMVRK
ncbi:MAG: hypothetical protein ACK55I_37245, partial [bacterium]